MQSLLVEVEACNHKWEDPKGSQLQATLQIVTRTGQRFPNTSLAIPLNLIYPNFPSQSLNP